ncbi:type II toxin-antitoxin system RelE/ParE family toxin [Mucilaginibacter ginkgonis]|uniref:Addiction module toxin RelE n=1 Tax=Mucilaginibacter ginkgonis TaxID=2682091 RepID=A0A6I4HYY4_9SPHI|nr:addiction module toxin RelE [Mucilaginibacter ginkgonis]QQL51459.1 addiction module toxin RelE [Mucilaginibacter ginkgonis]
MSNQVFVSPSFIKNVKPLAKKYPGLRPSIDDLILQLTGNPYLGESYGKGIYKIRLTGESIGRGKSGGFRVMYYHLTKSSDGIEVLLMTIFSKSEKSTIKKVDAVKRLNEILANYLNTK